MDKLRCKFFVCSNIEWEWKLIAVFKNNYPFSFRFFRTNFRCTRLFSFISFYGISGRDSGNAGNGLRKPDFWLY